MFGYVSGLISFNILDSLVDIVRSLGWNDPEKTFEAAKEFLISKGFSVDQSKPLSIHHPTCIRFMSEIVEAEQWVLDVAREGVSLDLNISPHETYQERNNKSARENMDALKEKVAKWCSQGYIEKLSEKPKIVNPMSVNIETDQRGNVTKKRPCIDLSRFINKRTPDNPIIMDNLTEVEPAVSKGDYMSTFDLTNCYFQFSLKKSDRKFLNFALPNDDGGESYFRFLIMMYGWKAASAIVTRYIKSLKIFLHTLCILIFIYLDDAIVLADSKERNFYKMKLSILVFNLAGFSLNYEKSQLIPTQVIMYQGFLIDSLLLRYTAHPDKENRYISNIKSLLDTPIISARQLAEVLGQLNSLRRSHGSVISILSRSSQHNLGVVLNENDFDYEATFCLSPQARAELTFLCENLHLFNGKYMPSLAVPMVKEITEIDNIVKNIKNTDEDVQNLLVSDASDKKAFLFFNGDISVTTDYTFDKDEKLASSTYRELKAIETFLLFLISKAVLLRNKTFFWQTDNRALEYIMSKGSRNPIIQKMVFQARLLCHRLGLTCHTIWTPRTHHRIQICDYYTKFNTSTDEWGLSDPALQLIIDEFKLSPTYDSFAHNSNHRFEKFSTLEPFTPHEHCNFFSLPLKSSEVYFACPPVKLVLNAFKKFVCTPNITAILVCPAFPSKNFWPIIFPNGPHPAIKHVLMFPTKLVNYNDVPNFLCKREFSVLALKIVT